ncbi:unnamed protein product [Caenorhabditis brenneri]
MTMPKEKTPEAPLLREGKTYGELEKEAEKERRGNAIWITATAIVVVVRVLLFAGFFYFGYREAELISEDRQSKWYHYGLIMILCLEVAGMVWNLFYCRFTFRNRSESGDDGTLEAALLTLLCIFYVSAVIPLLLEGETSSRIIYGCYGLFSIAYYWFHWWLLYTLQDRFGEGSKINKLDHFYEDRFWEPRRYEGQTYKQYLEDLTC